MRSGCSGPSARCGAACGRWDNRGGSAESLSADTVSVTTGRDPETPGGSMAIKVQRTDPGITQFDVDGETILVTYEPREIGVGAFRAAYHGSNISGPTLTTLA